jgi:hypothetical protein
MRLLKFRMQDTAEAAPRKIVLETRLTVRGSCAGPPLEQSLAGGLAPSSAAPARQVAEHPGTGHEPAATGTP